MTSSKPQLKPRVRFCWDCGKKLYGNHHTVVIMNGYEYILHKSCAKELQRNKWVVNK